MKLNLNLNHWSTRFLFLLLATDLVFIILHIIYQHTSFISNYNFSIEKDRGYAELFQYIKEYWIAILLAFLAYKKRSLLYLSWSLLFLYLLLDDSLEIHETGGKILSQKLSLLPMFNLRAVDFGEMLMSVGVGLFFFVLIAIAYRFSDSLARKSSRYLIIMLCSLALFGIVIDMVHIAFKSSLLNSWLGLLEDGGEHIVMSIIAGFVFLLAEVSQSEYSPFPWIGQKEYFHNKFEGKERRRQEEIKSVK
ncbi:MULTISPECIES: hypothetical protein [unclassified Coleofasciculus]|uniref:hypothetical protein n=1 Tax=unclassified Coleofasciculus TaxID=2692782 RepID=UPI001880A3FC|nr:MULTISPECIES: hypothetical protein [unclassified Coleofasciculus]MBE9124873.1 hypothetical protein [Coleofasciculus sp. LEGE 07081]MBE9147883.1 hypothetical protein [Coleofasciculus sp. LEGE 07092]